MKKIYTMIISSIIFINKSRKNPALFYWSIVKGFSLVFGEPFLVKKS